MKARIATRTVANGGAVWRLSNSIFEVVWIGPGSNLYLGRAFTPGARIVPIEHPVASGPFETYPAAARAVEAFAAATDAEDGTAGKPITD